MWFYGFKPAFDLIIFPNPIIGRFYLFLKNYSRKQLNCWIPPPTIPGGQAFKTFGMTERTADGNFDNHINFVYNI